MVLSPTASCGLIFVAATLCVAALWALLLALDRDSLHVEPMRSLLPDRRWLVVVPAHFCVTWFCVAWFYIGWSLHASPAPEDVATVCTARGGKRGGLALTPAEVGAVWRCGEEGSPQAGPTGTG